MKVSRRVFLQTTAGTLAGGLASPALVKAMSHSHVTKGLPNPDAMGSETPDLMIDWPAYVDRPVDAFTIEQRALVAAISETIIPKTETPGAIEARVPKFIELIFADWMEPDERESFLLGLKETDTAARFTHGSNFADLSASQQLTLLETIEAGINHPWLELGGPSFTDADAPKDIPFILVMKELTTIGFFMSEKGATEVLSLNPMGDLVADKPLSQRDSSWAATSLY